MARGRTEADKEKRAAKAKGTKGRKERHDTALNSVD